MAAPRCWVGSGTERLIVDRGRELTLPGERQRRYLELVEELKAQADYASRLEEGLAEREGRLRAGFEAERAALIAAMTKRYPSAGMGIALQIGAKVAKGEMKWG